jgi:hypothetical protein
MPLNPTRRAATVSVRTHWRGCRACMACTSVRAKRRVGVLWRESPEAAPRRAASSKSISIQFFRHDGEIFKKSQTFFPATALDGYRLLDLREVVELIQLQLFARS